MKIAIEIIKKEIAQRELANKHDHLRKDICTKELQELNEVVNLLAIHNVMPCISFDAVAKDQANGDTAVWTDGVALSSDNDRHCAYKLEDGARYKVVLYKA